MFYLQSREEVISEKNVSGGDNDSAKQVQQAQIYVTNFQGVSQGIGFRKDFRTYSGPVLGDDQHQNYILSDLFEIHSVNHLQNFLKTSRVGSRKSSRVRVLS